MGTSEPTTESLGTTADAKAPTLTRQQRREADRINKDAQDVYSRLAIQLYHFFMENNPESEEMAAKEKEILAKWKMYCSKRGLTDEAKGIIQQYIDQLHREYNEAKNDKAPE